MNILNLYAFECTRLAFFIWTKFVSFRNHHSGGKIESNSFYTVSTALNGIIWAGRMDVRACMHSFVCHEMYNYVQRTNDWTYNCQFLHTYVCWQGAFTSRFSSKSLSLTFIFKIKDSNRVHSEVHMWLSLSQMVTDRTNIAIANKWKVTYDLSIGIFIFHIGPF